MRPIAPILVLAGCTSDSLDRGVESESESESESETEPTVDVSLPTEPLDAYASDPSPWSMSCEGRRCTVAVEEDDYIQVLDAVDVAMVRAPGSSSGLVFADTMAVRTVDLGEWILDASADADGAWLLFEDRVEYAEYALAELVVWRRLALPQGVEFPTTVWGDRERVWVSSVDATWEWHGTWQLLVDEGRGKFVTVGDGWLAEGHGTSAHLWDLSARTASELYGSDDNMDWARPCGDGNYWITSWTGRSTYCTLDGACPDFPEVYVQGRNAVCVGRELGVLGDAGIDWHEPAGASRSEPLDGLRGIAGSVERTWVFGHEVR